jgi:hypothetical protein
MSKLVILGITAAAFTGIAHALLGAAWDFAVDDIDSPLPKGWTRP